MKELVKIAGMPRSTYYYHVKYVGKPDKYSEVKAKMERLFHGELKCRAGYRTLIREVRKTILVKHKTEQRQIKELTSLYGS